MARRVKRMRKSYARRKAIQRERADAEFEREVRATRIHALDIHGSHRSALRNHVVGQMRRNRGGGWRLCPVCEVWSSGNRNTHTHWMCDDCLNSWFVERMRAGRAPGCAECGWAPGPADTMALLHGANIPVYLAWADRQSRPVGVPHAGRCPRCGEIAERDGGCNNMVCICGETYCYRCGASVFGHNHRCSDAPDNANAERITADREHFRLMLQVFVAIIIAIVVGLIIGELVRQWIKSGADHLVCRIESVVDLLPSG